MPGEPLTINLSLTIAAPVERVWHVLTCAEDLEAWLCHATIDLRSGVYELSGSRLPGAPVEPVTQLLKSEPLKTLSFGWQLRGAATEVTIALTPLGAEATQVKVCHSGLTKRPTGCSGTTDFWVVALENLRLCCLDRQPVSYDFSTHGAEVELAVDIAADSAQLFEALLDPQALDEFWSSRAEIEPQVGGRYNYGWQHGGPTKILELEPGARLVTDWHYTGEPDTVVTWQLESSGGKTRITLTHTGFDADDDREDYRHGWLGFLVPFKARAELGEHWTRVQTDGYKVEDSGA
jgi:uncharacterized protein YndB with AHSA1/START domain